MSNTIKNYKVSVDSETYAISLVDEPAIDELFIALGKDKEPIRLSSDEKHMVYGAVLVPDLPIYRYDGENEYYVTFTKESIEKMALDFMREYRQKEITLDHNEQATEITVVESWLKADEYKDKSVALGLNDKLPVGTWFCGMKVNNVETWDRIKSGELRGFSVEALISLDEFSKQSNQDMQEESNMLFDKVKEYVTNLFRTLKEEEFEETPVETPNETVEAPVEEAPVAEEPVVEETPVEEPVSPTLEEVSGTPEVAVEEPKADSHIEDLIKNLQAEIASLKGLNESLNERVKELGKQPSAKPVNVNAAPSAGDTYSAWRDQMRKLV